MIKITLLPPQSAAIFPQRVAKLKLNLRLGVALLAACCCLGKAAAATVTLLASDGSGTSSFTGATNWSNGQIPSAANDYFVPKSPLTPNVDFIIRTTNNAAAVTFAGNSLTVEGYVAFKGTNILTVNDLRLTNGLVGNYSTGGNPAVGRLAGKLNVISNGVIYAGGVGLNMRILATISGSGALEIRQPNVVTLSATNTYNGPVTLTGSTLELDSTGSLTPSSLTLQPYIATVSIPTVTNIVRAGGGLNVGTGSAGVLRVGYRTSSATNCAAALDVSAQPQFTVNVGAFGVGINVQAVGSHLSVGTVNLATNNTVTATNILIADSIGASGGSSLMVLGGGSNYFNTPTMVVGARKQNAQLTLPAGGVFRLDNGAGRTDLGICVQDFNTSASPVGTASFSNGTFIASLGNLVIGEKTLGSSGGAAGTLTMGGNAANNVDANAVVIGNLTGADSGSPVVQGVLNFGGGSFHVNGNVTLASYDNSGIGSVSGILNVNGGTFGVAGDIVDGGGLSTLNLNGGLVDMQPAGDGAPGNITVDVLSGNGTITNAAVVAVSTLVTPGGTNTAGTITVSTLDLSSGAPLTFNLGSSLTIGGGSNDLLQVNGNLTLNNNTLTVTALSPLTTGTYRLINYTGTLGGSTSLSLVAPATRQSFSLDLATPGQVNLIVSGNPTSLLWSGDGSGNVWDSGSTPNWDAGADVFFGGDYVTFNDSGSAVPDIYVSVPVQPGSMTVSNTAQAYIFDGAPISTAGSLTKRGNNVLALANDGNGFSGQISIEAGTLSIGNGGGSGSLGTGAITNNGQLLINKNVALNMNNPISGSGSVRLTGGGAILNESGGNSYTGTTTVENGCQFNVLNNFALGSANTGTTVQAGGRVGFTSLGTWTVAEPLEINGYGIGATPGALYANTVNNDVTWTGPITVGSPSQIRIVNTGVKMTLANSVLGNQQTLQCTANDTGSILTFSNTLSLGNDASLATLTKDGVGMVVLAGSSNLCGSTVINNGTLEIVTTNAPQIGDVIVNAGTLQIGSGLADGSMPPGAINLPGSTAKLAINSSNTFVLNTQLTGAGGLSLLNYGTLNINSSNTFAGGITTGSGTPTAGGTISLSNSFGLGDGTAAKTVRLIHASLQLQGGLDIPAAISLQTSSGNVAGDITHGLTQVIHSLSGTNTIEGNIVPTSGAGNSEITVDSGLLTLNGTISPDQTARIVILSGAANGVLNGSLNDNGVNIPALTKQGAGTWTLNNMNNYSGVTVIQNGTLVLGTNATAANTPSVQVLSNAVLDVNAVAGGFTLGGSQTFQGTGNVLGSFNANGTVAPGPLGTLNFASSLTLSGTTVMELNRTNVQNADLISAAALAFGGTLTVTNLGDDLQAGDTFNLFDGAISGSFVETNLPALSSTNLFWDVSLLNSQGVIKVGGTVAPAPVITAPAISGTNLTMQVSSQSGFNYILETTPQLAPAAWTGIQTNAGGGVLTFMVPITTANLQQFFRILVQ